MSSYRSRSGLPHWSEQPAPSLVNQRDPQLIQLGAIPQFTSHRTMSLVQCLTVIRVRAPSNFVAAAQLHLSKPVGICQGLARQTDNVGLAASQNFLGLGKRRDTTAGHHRDLIPGAINRPFNRFHQRHTATERSILIRKYCRHTFIATLTGVGIDRLAHFRLLRVFKLSAFGYRQEIKTGPGKLNRKVSRIIDATTTGNYLVTQEANADDIVMTHPLTHSLINFQWQSHPILARAAIAIGAVIECTQETRHRVSMGIVQFHAVEPRLTRT